MCDKDKMVHFCGPCQRQRIYRLAEYFCTGCQRSGAYICLQCKDHHEKFEELTGHQIQTVSQTSSTEASCSGLQQLPNMTSHQTQVMSQHRTQTVSQQSSSDSSSCSSLAPLATFDDSIDEPLQNHIQSYNRDANFMQRVQNIIDIYEKSKIILASAKEKRQSDAKNLREDKENIESEIRFIRKSLKEQLDQLESAALTELNFRHRRAEMRIIGEIEKIDDCLAMWEENMRKLTEAQELQESIMIVETGNKLDIETKNLVDMVTKHNKSEKLQFVVNPDIKGGLIHLPSFGHFGGDHIYDFNTKFLGEYDITARTDDEDNVCDITDCCVMSDGTVVLADCSNASLKHLDKAFTVTNCCHLPDPPTTVCTINDSQVACTIPKKKIILFVSVGQKMLPQRFFYAGYSCLCVRYSPQLSQLFVTYDDPMQICVFNLEGDLQQTIRGTEKQKASQTQENGNHKVKLQDNTTNNKLSFSKNSKKSKKKNEIFKSLEEIIVISTERRIYACDLELGLLVLSTQGEHITTIRNFKHFPEFAPKRICEGHDKDFFMFGQSEKTKKFGILHVGRDKKVQRLEGDFLTMQDIQETESICFNSSTSQLIVCQKNDNTIKVFYVT